VIAVGGVEVKILIVVIVNEKLYTIKNNFQELGRKLNKK